MRAFDYSEIASITFAPLRRFRELVWIGIGLACLAVVGRQLNPLQEDTAS